MLYIAIGILGATVMPHNLYLHSSIVQTRKYELIARRTSARRCGTRSSTRRSRCRSRCSSTRRSSSSPRRRSTRRGNTEVAEIQDAHQLLTPLLGVGGASTVFALALLASGQNSTLTGTLAGQIVMEGFLDIRLRPWLRRLITRARSPSCRR